jgi:NADH:ubiquinone oxidoreductase subunit 5 (subunit L)/multisubunit Na+/H+ antiporter MnhA subunit
MGSCLAIAGIVPFSGFFSKDEILAGAWLTHPPGWPMWAGKVFWIGLLVTALGTAFYMWRLYFLVFSGEGRTPAAKHAHESPPTMTGPLIVLAFLATIAGAIGFPHLHDTKLPAITHGLSSWLEPAVSNEWNDPPDKAAKVVGSPQSRLAADLAKKTPDAYCCCVTSDTDPGTSAHGKMTVSQCAAKGGTPMCTLSPTKHCTLEEAHDSTTFALMGVALAIGALGIFFAWMLYARGPSKTVERLVEGPLGPAYEASKNKLWVDEAYDKVIVGPFKTVARGLFEVVDRFVIDTVAVNGTAFVIGIFGRIARWVQNGQVQRYLVGIIVGAALVFLVSQWKHDPSFDYEIQGNTVKLKAAPGEGVSSMAKIEWDLDSNGTIDLTGPEVTALRGDVGKVTMYIDDPVSRERTQVTRVVVETAPAEEGTK